MFFIAVTNAKLDVIFLPSVSIVFQQKKLIDPIFLANFIFLVSGRWREGTGVILGRVLVRLGLVVERESAAVKF